MSTPWKNLARPGPGYSSTWASQLVSQLNRIFSDVFLGDFETKAKLIFRGGKCENVTAVANSSYVIKLTDFVVDVNFAGAVALTLPQNPILGQSYRVQDSSGAASSNNITIGVTGGDDLNGGPGNTVVINTNYGRKDFVYNGTQWIGS